ncbi:unnamed protein product [Clonostachys rhizophaga]|uniref:FAD dependent oxidoreductase domain-containing protein n=1 Tax=Clonostachys rhizophaga TaxID=160324 RepID=A0A9N9V403_9HYPO|nr:unnamed protein product [Clonostachys rhizophaga]
MTNNSASSLAKTSRILIVGAGVFGLSTAIHAARRGYTNITVFDRQPYEQSNYDFDKGCDAASADINKIVRTAYGDEIDHQEMCTEAIKEWREWDQEIASGKDLPPGMTTEDRVFVNNGSLSLSATERLDKYEVDSIHGMRAAGLGKSALVTSDDRDQAEASKQGFAHALDPFRRKEKGLPYIGLLDTTGGYAVADNACRLALHKAKRLGVRFVFGDNRGSLKELVYRDESRTDVTGIITEDGSVHSASLVLLACGGWTPALVPQLDGITEATAGSVALVKIPPTSRLREKYSEKNFPTFQFRMYGGRNGGLYGFACDNRGVLKIGYRGTRYTNPLVQPDGKERSVPITRWTLPHRTDKIAAHALAVINHFIDEEMPDVRAEGLGITRTRLCWYTDTFDDHYIIDYVPESTSLMVATGCSGHAFKFLPNIGKHVVDIWEREATDQLPKSRWLWRQLREGQKPDNIIMQGSAGPNTLSKANMVLLVQEAPLAKL